MTSKKDAHELVRSLKDAGYEVSFRRNGHYKVTRVTTTGQFSYTFPASPSDFRSLRNTCSALGKLGFEFTHKGRTYKPKGDT